MRTLDLRTHTHTGPSADERRFHGSEQARFCGTCSGKEVYRTDVLCDEGFEHGLFICVGCEPLARAAQAEHVIIAGNLCQCLTQDQMHQRHTLKIDVICPACGEEGPGRVQRTQPPEPAYR